MSQILGQGTFYDTAPSVHNLTAGGNFVVTSFIFDLTFAVASAVNGTALIGLESNPTLGEFFSFRPVIPNGSIYKPNLPGPYFLDLSNDPLILPRGDLIRVVTSDFASLTQLGYYNVAVYGHSLP